MIRKQSGAALLLAASLLPGFAASAQAPAPKQQVTVNTVTFDKIVFEKSNVKTGANDRGIPYARFILNDDSNMAVYVEGRPLCAIPNGLLLTTGSILLSPMKKPDGFDRGKTELRPASRAVVDQATAELQEARALLDKTLTPVERHWIELVP